jgi:hypothetical protein
MTDKRALMGTAGLKSPLLDAAGHPLAAETVKIIIRSMPKIERDALPDLPDDIEARLFHVPDQDPCIVLFHPPSELHIEMPLTDRDNFAHYVEALNTARLKQAMGEPPDAGDGYRVDG